MTIRHRRWGGAALTVALSAAAALVGTAATAPNASSDTGANCAAAYVISWSTPSNNPPDFGVGVTITNNSTYPISGWSVTWNYTAGQKIIDGSAYSAIVVQNGTTVAATPAGSYNATLNPGASTAWGFHATFDGTNNPVPTVTCSGPSQGTASATLGTTLQPLGVNTAAWDTNFVDPEIATYLSNANVGLVRYPGGSWADEYFWQTNTAKSETQSVDFAAYSKQVDAVTGGQKFVTVNYGQDTPASSGAWAKQAASTSGQGVALWEIGNEMYGSWETDTHTGAHTAASYATNAVPYIQAIKAADPSAQVCYDYGMDGGLAPGSGVDNWQTWNSTILQADAAYYDCADVHWYPINGVPTESVQSIMELVDNIPAAAAEVKATLAAYDPTEYFVVGETNMSQTANEWNEEPVGALFAAANSLEWLANGAQSVDWWDVHNYGTQTADFGKFSSATTGEPAMNTPYPPYYGHLLASKLAVKGAKVGTLVVSTPNIYGYYSNLPGGSYAVLLANADPSKGYTLSTSSLGITSSSETQYTYSAANPTIATSTLTSGSVSVPAESIVVLTNANGTPPTTTTTTTTKPVTTTTTTVPVTTTTTKPVTTTTTTTTKPVTTTTTTTRPVTTTTTTTTTTTKPVTTTTTTSGGTGKTCSAAYAVTGQWTGGFQGNVTVTAGSSAISGWKVAWTYANGQTISQSWSATVTSSGSAVTATNMSWNGALGAGANTSFGFLGSWNGTNTVPTVTCTAS